jgi:myo-inositol-1(or 4)-monophosphatase
MDAATMFPFLQRLAHESAKVITPLFANPDLQVEWKADATPVTYADKKAEEILRKLISDEFPSHGVIGEEFGSDNEEAEFTWVLDPIDGTKTFTAGSPHFGTLICLRQNQRPIWGAIHLPIMRQLYIGNNEGAWCNEREIHVRDTPALKDCFLVYTDPKGPFQRHSITGWNTLFASTGQARSWGDCFGYTLVASGGVDIMCDPIMNLWDIAALLPVMRGAGAVVSDWQGNDPSLADSLIACHPRHHATVVSILNPRQ